MSPPATRQPDVSTKAQNGDTFLACVAVKNIVVRPWEWAVRVAGALAAGARCYPTVVLVTWVVALTTWSRPWRLAA
jgi:hypothetical protein